MAILRNPDDHAPALHPGEMLREDFLNPLGMTAEMLAQKIRVPVGEVVVIVKEQQTLDADMCLRLARFFRMSPRFSNREKDYELQTAMDHWPVICREVPMRRRSRNAGALRSMKTAPQGRIQ